MINRLKELEIPEETPFKHDKFGREQCADNLIAMFKIYASTGCVIGLNGKWGAGKTTFIKMLEQKLKNDNAHTLYFNAWEHDYINDPFIALLAELKQISRDSSKYNKMVSLGGKILINLGKYFIKNKLGVDSELLSLNMNDLGDFFNKEIDDFINYQKTLIDFKKALIEFIASNTTVTYPVVFFIDELDRCNPCFAVKVLERIKHLFDIPNIIFVLAINKQQLEYSIQGYYGSSNIDAGNYLRRFIDIEYLLPNPEPDDICQYLYNVHDYNSYFMSQDRTNYKGDEFKDFAKILITYSNFDIRTWDKIFTHCRLVIETFTKTQVVNIEIFFLLCYLKIKYNHIYNKIREETYTAQELLTELEIIFPNEMFIDNINTIMTDVLSIFIKYYNHDRYGHEKEKKLGADNNQNNSLKTRKLDNNKFLDYYNGFNIPPKEISLQLLLDHIELHRYFPLSR